MKLDASRGDPISNFSLRSTDYSVPGVELAFLRLPNVYMFEDRCAAAQLGVNTENVLGGFEANF
jgi:hypothetical protein